MQKSISKQRVNSNLLFDLLCLTIAFCIVFLVFKSTTTIPWLDSLLLMFSYGLTFVLTSIALSKYSHEKQIQYYLLLDQQLKSWLIASGAFVTALYMLEMYHDDKKLLVIALVIVISVELFLTSLRHAFQYALLVDMTREENHMSVIFNALFKEQEKPESIPLQVTTCAENDELLSEVSSEEVRSFICRYSPVARPDRFIANTNQRHQILSAGNEMQFHQIVNLTPINRVRFINKFLEVINIKLQNGGVLFLSVETIEIIKKRLLRKGHAFPGTIQYTFDFIIHRIWPRLPYARKIYFALWGRLNKRISYAETLGRLYSCGFEHLDEMQIGNQLWLAVQKRKQPELTHQVTYGPIIKLKRKGKNNKEIFVYKLRTMHPYSEFLQAFVYEKNKLDEGGKFKSDFRISSAGKILRKFWIDEIPMLINILRGDLKIVGVRPLSKHYLSLYPEDFQQKRSLVRPGLIPPFYADMPKTLEEIVASENKYIDKYLKYGLLTDISYFFKAFWNIVVKRARSK